MAYVKELLKGNTDPLLLSLINLRAMYGYEIIKEVARRSEGYFKLNEGTLYPALHRLEKAGLIEGRWQPSITGQERRYYHITDKGHDVLTARRKEWKGFARAVELIFGV
ncbi:MAG: helix-turn-helix transcriptional regulator [Chloroflexi bacterium]|nr:helix-turn-helix transcriptional regulator [Chloroflexota bacterium]